VSVDHAADELTEDAARRQLRVVLPGILLAMLLSQLDTGILSTALPAVVGDLGGISQLSWAVTGYLLTLTASTPLYGKLGDLYGRKRVFMWAISLFLLGSVLSGLAQSMTQLVVFRAIQGLGAGGLVVNVVAVIGELAPPRDRGRFQSYIAVLGAAAAIAGPLLGGVFTDYVTWRWAFFVNLPIGAVSLAIVTAKLHLPRRVIRHRVDYLGALLLTVLAAAIVLITTWGGIRYDWTSPQILALAVVGVLALAGVVVVEWRAAEPILPMRLFGVSNFSIAQVISFLVGFGMYTGVAYLPLYEQAVQHSTATNSGLLLLPFLLGSVVTTLAAGSLLSRTDNHRTLMVVGSAGFLAGEILLAMLDVDTNPLISAAYMLVYGLGLGVIYQVATVTAQNSVEKSDIGVTSSSIMFFRMIGGAFGVSVFGAILAGRLVAALGDKLPPDQASELAAGGGQFDPSKIEALPDRVQEAYTAGVADGTHNMFLLGIPFAAVALLISFAVRKAVPRSQAAQAEAEPVEPGTTRTDARTDA
jgi:EmrB/QacA subfamily drug resistance transporter